MGDILVVTSKVKALIKDKGCNTSADSIEALSDLVACIVDRAAKRAAANGRKTVKAQDI